VGRFLRHSVLCIRWGCGSAHGKEDLPRRCKTLDLFSAGILTDSFKNSDLLFSHSRPSRQLLLSFCCEQVRGEELLAGVLPPARDALPHRRLQPAADWDDERILRRRGPVADTTPEERRRRPLLRRKGTTKRRNATQDNARRRMLSLYNNITLELFRAAQVK